LVGDALERLAQHAEVKIYQGTGQPDREALLEGAREADGLICVLTDRIDAQLVQSCRKLRVLASCSVGLDHVDVAACTARNIPVGFTPGVLVDTTADLAFGLMLAAARRLVEADRFVREGRWTPERKWEPGLLLGRDLSDATLGIVGLGEIGQAMARRAQGFGMRVLGWTRSGRSVPGVTLVPFEQLLAESDYVSLHVALTDETRDLIHAAELARMRPTAILVNTARGGIVNESALNQALRAGKLAAAALDVFAVEPTPSDNPLLELPNVVVAPHIGSASVRTRTRMSDLTVDNVLAGLRGEHLPRCANPTVYGTEHSR
jgi:glyoxylate reductase